MATQGKPNILFLFPDQQRPDWLGCSSDLPVKTPTLDKLAESGMRFTRCYTPSPLCAPARASLASGRGYDQCRVETNRVAYPLDLPTFYQSLRDEGYRVCGVGKFDLDKPTLEWNLDGSRLIEEWGFTEGIDNEGKLDGSNSYRSENTTPAGSPTGPYLKALADGGVADAYEKEHRDARSHCDAYTTAVPDELYCDNWLSTNGMNSLRSFPKDKPWFLQVNFTGPHNPMDVTPSMRERWDSVYFPQPHANEQPKYTEEDHLRNRQNYAAMIENIDMRIAEYIKLVEERGELDNTLIVYSSDHGEMLGDHGKWGKGTPYEPSLGVPLIVSGPGVQKSVVSDTLVSMHDLSATFLKYAGCAPLPEADALSLRPVLSGDRDEHRTGVYCGLRKWRCVVTEQHKLVTEEDQPDRLYDLKVDPLEDNNIAESNPDLVAELKGMIK